MICMHVKRSSAVKYVSLACQKFFNYAPTPTKSERRARKRREWSSPVSFILAGAEKQATVFCAKELQSEPTRLVVLRAYCACHCDSQFVMAGTAPCHICVHHVLHTSVSLARPQSAWHIPLWCALNCSQILKLFLLLHLLLLLRSCQRICRRVILIFERLIERLGMFIITSQYLYLNIYPILLYLSNSFVRYICLFIPGTHTHKERRQYLAKS